MTPRTAADGDSEAASRSIDEELDQKEGGNNNAAAKVLGRRREKQISTASLNWAIPPNDAAALHVQEEQGDDSWQYRLLKLLHGRKVQTFLASLLFLDVLILVAELTLLTICPTCHLVERDAISCCPVTTTGNVTDPNYFSGNEETRRWLAGGEADYSSCAADLQPYEEYAATCDSHKWHRVHSAETVLVSVTLTILSIYFVELSLAMVALTPAVFFRQVRPHRRLCCGIHDVCIEDNSLFSCIRVP